MASLVKCPVCGGDTKYNGENRAGGDCYYRIYKRTCTACGCKFHYTPKTGDFEILDDSSGARPVRERCTLSTLCPEWRYCTYKESAHQCATFRAVVIKRMPTEE